MTTRQYFAVAFRPGDIRTYTYHHDGEDLAVGDKVVVTTARGESTVTIVAVVDEAPKFETKAIVRKVEEDAADTGAAIL